MLSTSPSDSNPAVELGDTLIPDPNPRAYPHKVISDTDVDDNEGPKLAWSPKDNMLFKIADAPWYPHALRFLSQVPQSDGDWSRHISCNDDIQSLCHSLKLPSDFQDHIDWSRLFDECARHLAQACHNPPLASFFSLIFVATCQVALVGGCPRKTVLRGLEFCARHCGVAEDELTELVLDNVREGVITGIRLLKEYTRVVGCRANEIPLHSKLKEPRYSLCQNSVPKALLAQDCLQLFRRCDSACFSFIQSHISSTYRPTTPLQSDCLEIPALVYDLLGGGVRSVRNIMDFNLGANAHSDTKSSSRFCALRRLMGYMGITVLT
jgi:hypothetical protein